MSLLERPISIGKNAVSGLHHLQTAT